MPIRPIKNNAQRQPITTTLRNIIREYPAGGGILRELCQNADDARARHIEFILDDNTYSERPLIDPSLEDFQGPALLAYNDSLFTDKDFLSLSRIGDSMKATDMEATGKFGRGFNSVYNWTDSPSIVSGASLLILDPHETWSDGGPLYDFVDNKDNEEMINQLTPFHGSVKQFDHSKELKGTIIRLPLRTKAHAARSKIVPNCETTPADIVSAFEKFRKEIVESLLFLRNIRSITLRVGSKIYANAETRSYTFSTASPQAREPACASGAFDAPYRNVLIERSQDYWGESFVSDISLIQDGEPDTIFSYAIRHHMSRGADGCTIREWARGLKMFPWVAVAAPIIRSGSTRPPGRLFSTLPLPIHTRHPFHIHGMFSITPDRASLHTGSDETASEDSESARGAIWNDHLFNTGVVDAWRQNLELLRALTEHGGYPFGGWDYWPVGLQGPGNWRSYGSGILRELIGLIIDKNYRLLPTIHETFESPSKCMYAQDLEAELLSALKEAKVPVVLPSEISRYEFIKHGLLDGLNRLCPRMVREYFNTYPPDPSKLTLETRLRLLEYILEDRDYTHIGTSKTPLIPLADGSYRSLRKGGFGLRLSVSVEERALFTKWASTTVDIERISEKTYAQLVGDLPEILGSTSIVRWDLAAAVSYVKSYQPELAVPNRPANVVHDPQILKWVDTLWQWATDRTNVTAASAAFSELCLVPLLDNRYAKGSALVSSPALDVSSSTESSQLFRNIYDGFKDVKGGHYFFFGDRVSGKAKKIFREARYLSSCTDITELVKWLRVAASGGLFDRISEIYRRQLINILNTLIRASPSYPRAHEAGYNLISVNLKGLPLFHAKRNDLTSENVGGTEPRENTPWISLDDQSLIYIGVNSNGVPVSLTKSRVCFVELSNEPEATLIELTNLIPVPSLSEILSQYIIPAIASSEPTHKQEYCEYALGNVSFLNESGRDVLANASFIPSDSPNVMQSPRTAVDREALVAQLYFVGENRLCREDFLKKHRYDLETLGMIKSLTCEVALERIETFSGCEPDEDLCIVIQTFFEFSPPQALTLPKDTKWLPGRYGSDEELTLYTSSECREKSAEHLFKYALPIVELEITGGWRSLLGWNKPPPKDVVRRQLDGVVHAKDVFALGVLLRAKYLDPLFHELRDVKWIPGQSGYYFQPSDVFASCGDFAPYLDTIDNQFRVLVMDERIGIENYPAFEKLESLQRQLSEKERLDDADIKVQLALLDYVSKLFPDADHGALKAPDRSGCLRGFSELTIGYGSAQDDPEFHFLHPGIPQITAELLRIPKMGERILQNLGAMEDFEQVEDPIVMIKDTLRRYPVGSIFNEYLANAEDSRSASKLAWVIDHHNEYPKESLVGPELADFQGPALFCYNDGVFSRKDFLALIRVGVGSKQGDGSKLGRFGRGSLTMYHFTAVPSFISGEYFVIFDPEKKRLPSNPNTRKRLAGIKLKISDVRRAYPDQLRPFEGLFGFDGETKNYPGTLFRFPIAHKAGLTNGISPFGVRLPAGSDISKHLKDYYENAQRSLIFLNLMNSIEAYDGVRRGSQLSLRRIWRSEIQRTNLCELVEAVMTNQLSNGPPQTTSWLVKKAKDDRHTLPRELWNIRDRWRLEARYGVAAPIQTSSGATPRGSLFMDTPLRGIEYGLPVSITADLALQSNRQDIPIDPTVDPSSGAEWNQWILTERVVSLYLSLLEFIAGRYGELAYGFWPEQSVSTGGPIGRLISGEFWSQIPSSPYRLFIPLGWKCVSTTKTSGSSPSNSDGSGDEEQQACELTTSEALFDLGYTDTRLSRILHIILQQYGYSGQIVDLSRHRHVRNGVGMLVAAAGGTEPQANTINSITPSFIRERLLSKENSEELCRFSNSRIERESILFANLMERILQYVFSDGPQVSDLLGRHILPLQNETLGAVATASSGGNDFLVGCQEGSPSIDSALLDLRPDIIIHSELPLSLIAKLLDPNLGLNVRPVSIHDLGRLVGRLSVYTIEDRLRLLRRMWATYDRLAITQGDNMRQFQGMEVHCVKSPNGCNQATTFHTWETISNYAVLPAVVEQLERALDSIVKAFPDLMVIDSATYPTSKRSQESLREVAGFHRLVSAITQLAAQKGQSITEYVENSFQIYEANGGNTQTLADSFLTSPWPESEQFYQWMRHVPMWQIRKLGPGASALAWVPASDLLQAPTVNMDWSSVAERGNFLNNSWQRKYQSQLGRLQVPKVTISTYLNDYVQVRERSTLPQDRLTRYVSFLEKFISSHSQELHQYPIALTGDRRFCFIKDLYDYNQSLFRAAFRNTENEHFLHPRLRSSPLKNHTISSGLGWAQTYACAREIHLRVSSGEMGEQLFQDAQTVYTTVMASLQHLVNSRQLNRNSISELFQYSFVPVKHTFPHDYRRNRKQELVPPSKVTSLLQGIPESYHELGWSRHPIFDSTPCDMVMEQLRPQYISQRLVLEHLLYIHSIRLSIPGSEIPRCLSDIRHCYQHLETRIQQQPVPNNSPIFLNIGDYDSSVDSFRTSWVPASSLVLGLEYNSLDDSSSATIQRIRSFLQNFKSLLKASGAQRLTPFQSFSSSGGSSGSQSTYESALLDTFRRFRHERKFTDFTLIAAGANGRRREIQVHRAVLAAASEYFAAMLRGGQWAEGTTGTSQLEDISPEAAADIVDYIYSGNMTPISDQNTEVKLYRLLELLEVSDRFLLEPLKAMVEDQLGSGECVRPETVEDILERAELCRATRLAQACKVYIRDNVNIMSRVN